MSNSSKATRIKPELTESFEERVDMLFEELSFAVQVRRPSILLVSFESGHVRDIAELLLEIRLAEIGQQIVPFPVDESHFDILLLLSQKPERERSIFSVTGLGRGGGKANANAYRALNMRRELMVDDTLRIIVWLTRRETIELSEHAPDFWAFRHRAINMNDPIETCERTVKRLKQRMVTAGALNNEPSMAKLWEGLGLLYLDLGQFNRAVRAYWKAIRFFPQNAGLWRGLGHLYHFMKRFPDAIIAQKQVLRLDPEDRMAHVFLLDCYRIMGKEKQAEEQEGLARETMQNESEYNRAIFESVCGNTHRAVNLLKIALEKRQVEANDIKRDPFFNFIRDDPNFLQVLRTGAPKSQGIA